MDQGVETKTLASAELGAAVRRARTGLGLSGRDFIEATSASCSVKISNTGQLSRIESGERGLTPHAWRGLLDALERMSADSDTLEVLRTLLPSRPSTIEELATPTLTERMARWGVIATKSLERREGSLVLAATQVIPERHLVERFRNDAEQIVELVETAQGVSFEPVLEDRAVVVAIEPPIAVVAQNSFFQVRVTLRNDGSKAWEDRLLLRLGPLITSNIALAPPLLLVPKTSTGETCEIVIPGRSHYLPGTCVITYAMVYANGEPCMPGGLEVRVISQAPWWQTERVPRTLVRLFRSVVRRQMRS